MCKKVAIKQGGTLSNFRFGEAHPVALSPRKTAPPEPWYTSLEEGRTVFVCEMSNVKREKSSEWFKLKMVRPLLYLDFLHTRCPSGAMAEKTRLLAQACG